VKPTEHPMIMSAEEDMLPWEDLKLRLQELLAAVEQDDYARVRVLLRETVHGYVPEGEIVDWIHLRNRER
jgi:FlaA1/EpsC-like NDP-sugar epimerase